MVALTHRWSADACLPPLWPPWYHYKTKHVLSISHQGGKSHIGDSHCGWEKRRQHLDTENQKCLEATGDELKGWTSQVEDFEEGNLKVSCFHIVKQTG